MISDEEIISGFGKRLRAARMIRKMTQEEIGLAIGADKQVVGAKRVKVDLPAGIHEITASDNAVEVARYTLDGRQISAPVAGVNVVRMSDGTCRKELVK